MSKIPFFSIVTVVRNDLPGLIKTTDTIIKQSNSDYEWIVIDGASTDGCVDFLKGLDKKFLTWISEPDTGIYQAMNKGITLANGKYIVFLNAGDVFSGDNVLENVYKKFTETDSEIADVLLGGATLQLPSGHNTYRAPKPISYVWHGLPSNHQATYYNSQLLKNNKYDESFRISGDYYIIAKLFTVGITTIILDESLVNFRIGDLSFKNPKLNLVESDKVQRDVLKMTIGQRVYSTLKKVVAITALRLLAKNHIPNRLLKNKKF